MVKLFSQLLSKVSRVSSLRSQQSSRGFSCDPMKRSSVLSFSGVFGSHVVSPPSSDPYAWGDMFPSCHPFLEEHHSPINLDYQMTRNESLGSLHLEGFDVIQTGHWTLKNDGHAGDYTILYTVLYYTDTAMNVYIIVSFMHLCCRLHVSGSQSCCRSAVACQ